MKVFSDKSYANQNTHQAYRYGFLLHTKQRFYSLYCKTEKEREMWLAALNYAILLVQHEQSKIDKSQSDFVNMLKENTNQVN